MTKTLPHRRNRTCLASTPHTAFATPASNVHLPILQVPFCPLAMTGLKDVPPEDTEARVPAAVWRAAALQRRPPPPGPPPRTGRAHSPSQPPAWGLRSCFHQSGRPAVSPAPPGSPAALFPNSRFSISRLCLSNTNQRTFSFLQTNQICLLLLVKELYHQLLLFLFED